MRSNLIGYRVAVASICLGTVTNGMADGGTFIRGCAAREMQIRMMLEGSEISPQERNKTTRTMVDARLMCLDGYVVDALALYDGIAPRLPPY
jgi:hypothetical protein